MSFYNFIKILEIAGKKTKKQQEKDHTDVNLDSMWSFKLYYPMG